MNEIVQLQRDAVPDDPRSDEQITLAYGDSPNGSNLASKYPQFGQEYAQLSAQRKIDLQPSLPQEFAAGASRGTSSLLATGQGALAAGSQAVGASGLRDYFLAKAQANEQAAADNPASVPTAGDVTDVSSALHYGAGKLGELAPNVAEAAITSAVGAGAGALAGGAVDPAGGEVVGSAGGALVGLFRSAAIKSLLKSYAVDSVEDLGAKVGTDVAQKAIGEATKNLGAAYGAHVANTMNFWAQSAGSTYNTLSKNPDIDPSTALNVSIYGGLAQAIPAQFLPSSIVKTFFGSEPVGDYFTRLVAQAAKLVPEGAAAMSLQELAAIASEKYANPSTRGDAFDISKWSTQDRQRLIESSVTGALAGFVGAPVAAIPGGKPSETAPETSRYTGTQTPTQAADMQAIAQRDASGSLSLADQDVISGFTPEQRNAYVLLKQRVQPPAPPASPDVSGSEVIAPAVALTPPASDASEHQVVSDAEALAAARQVLAAHRIPNETPAPIPDAQTPPQAVQPTAPVAVSPAVAQPSVSPALLAARGASASALTPEALDQRSGSANPGTQNSSVGSVTNNVSLHLEPAESTFLKHFVDSSPRNAEMLTKSREGQSILAKLNSFIKRPLQPSEPVDISMLPLGKELKISNGVVESIPVDVVNDLLGGEFSSKILLHNKSVFKLLSPDSVDINANQPITGRVLGELPDVSASARSSHEPNTTIETSNVNKKTAPVKFLGVHVQPGFQDIPPMNLYNLTEDAPGLGVKGSTISERSIIKAGYEVPKPEVEASTPRGILHEKVVSRAGSVGPEHIDFNNSTLAAEKSGRGVNRGKEGAGETKSFEPSYFIVNPSESKDPKSLGERLVSGARSSDPTEAYQNSRRVTVVEDKQTGKIFLLSTFKEKTDGSIKLADPSKVGERAPNTRLSDLLAEKTTDGKQRYEPIASMRLNELKNRLVQEFPDHAAYDAAIGDHARATMETLASHAEAVESNLMAGAAHQDVNLEGNKVPETPESEEEPASNEPEVQAHASEEGFTSDHAQALWNIFGGEEEGDFDRNRFDALIGSDLKNSARGIAAVKAAFEAFREAHPDVDVRTAMDLTLNGIYEDLEKGYSDGKEAFKESASRHFGEQRPESGADSTAAAATPAAGVSTPEQQPQGQGGNPIPRSTTGLAFRKPQGVQEVTQDHARLLDDIHRAAIAGGMNVQRIGQDLSGMSGEFAKRTGASYDRASRTVAQVMGTVIGKEDVVTALHEVGHDVFTKLPPNLQERVLAAIDALSDRQLGVDVSTDPRIRAANPQNLSAKALSEERLVEATAQSLAAQGFSPQASQGYAQAFVRALKDVYYRAAMSVQRALFGDSFTNGTLAQRFFENKVKSFLAGDFNDRTSFVDMLGGGKPPEARAASWHSNGSPLFERIGDNGRPSYDHVPDDNPAAVTLNNLVLRQPDPAEDATVSGRQRTDIEMRFALANHAHDQFEEAAKSARIANLAKTDKADPVTWLAKILRLQDPNDTKKQIEVDAEARPGLKYDPLSKLDSFAGSENAGKVTRDAYINGQSMLGRISRADANAADHITNMTARKDKALQEHEEAKATMMDAHKQMVDFQRDSVGEIRNLAKDIEGTSRRLGVIGQQIKDIDPAADLRKYAPQFQKLFAGRELEGQNLADIMDKLATDPSVDLEQSASKIRKAMLNDPAYADFTRDTPESKLLFASVVGLAKTNKRVMANMAARRMINVTERLDLQRQLEGLRSETKRPLSQTIQGAARAARIKERALVAYREKLSEVRSINKGIAQAGKVRDAAAALTPIVTRENAKLAAKQSIGVGFTFAHEEPYMVPLSKDASTEALLKPRDLETPVPGWERHTLKLDSSQKKVSNPSDVESHLRMMAAFLGERESQFDAGQQDAKDAAYWGTKRTFDEMSANKNFTLNVSPYERWMFTMAALPEGEKVEQAANTPEARRFAGMVRTESSEINRMSPSIERIVARNAQLKAQLLRLMPNKVADKQQVLERDVLNPAKKELESHPDLHEQFAGRPDALNAALYNRVMDKLLSSDATSKYVGANREAWRNGLINLLEHQRNAKEYLESQTRGEADQRQHLGRQSPTGHGVLDPRLKAINIATGKLESATRAPIGSEYTFPRKLSQTFKDMVNAVRNSGWIFHDPEGGRATSLATEDFSKIAEAYKTGGDEAVHAIVDKYFSNAQYGSQVRKMFLEPIARMQTESLFEAPKKPDAVTSFPADVQKMNEAYDKSNGDPVEFLKQMYEAHGETGEGLGDYIQSQMLRLASLALENDQVAEKMEPTGTIGKKSIQRMTAPFSLNARMFDNLPGEWFDYHTFDKSDTYGMMKRIAAQNAYGRNGEAGQRAVDTVVREIRQAGSVLRAARDKVTRESPGVIGKQLDKLIAKEVGGESEYDKLNKLSKREPLVQSAVRALSTTHRRDFDPNSTVDTFSRAFHTIGQMMMNQPSSAIGLMTQMTDLNLRYGPGALGSSLKGVGGVGKDLVSSLASAVGLQILNGGEESRLYRDRGLADPHSVTTLRDTFQRMEGEGLVSHFFRMAHGVMSATVNPLGEKNQSIPVRPFQPFDMVGAAVDKNITQRVWGIGNQMVELGRDFYGKNLEKFNDPDFKLDAGALGLKGWKKDLFERFTGDAQKFGVNFDDMVRNAMQRNDKTNMTNQEAARLYSMGLNNVALRTSLANFSAAWNNNAILRVAAPLMGWSWRRMQQLGTIHLNAEGKKDMASFAKGIAGLSLAAGGGLAVSALVDQYYQNLIGKERNLRPIIGAPDATQAALGVMEDLNRVGTFGMFGELGNAVLNVGQGGDNRDLSIDQRVLAVNSLQSILGVASAWINQGQVDYAHVVRPLLQSVGGTGLLQYQDLANRALGLDNAESRTIARINSQNYLRVVGRELGMDVRTADGGTFTPTSVSPYLTKMEQAAYGNSAGDFQEAYRGAIEAAREAGHDDPVAYIKSAFASRNPLKTIFTTSPSQADYARLLANMPGSGEQDVSQAVSLFNHYTSQIGGTPFFGKTEKVKAPSLVPPPRSTTPRLSIGDIRQRSTLALQ